MYFTTTSNEVILKQVPKHFFNVPSLMLFSILQYFLLDVPIFFQWPVFLMFPFLVLTYSMITAAITEVIGELWTKTWIFWQNQVEDGMIEVFYSFSLYFAYRFSFKLKYSQTCVNQPLSTTTNPNPARTVLILDLPLNLSTTTGDHLNLVINKSKTFLQRSLDRIW